MKHIFHLGLVLLSLVGPAIRAQIPTSAPANQASTPQPVYFYLYSKVTDHVNMDITEARLRRLLPMLPPLIWPVLR